jgi:WD40 repeat protein
VDGRRYCEPIEGDPPLVEAPAGADLRSRVLDVDTGEVVLDLGDRSLLDGKFNPGSEFAEPGRYLAVAVAGDVNVLEIHDLSNGEILSSVERPEFLAVRFDPTGRWLYGWGFDAVWVLDLAAVVDGSPAEEAFVFDRIASVGTPRATVSGDGVLATSGNGEGLMRLWDLATGDQLIEFRTDRIDGPAVGWDRMAFSPDGDDLLYQDAASTFRWFPLDPDRLVELAGARLTRGFTPEECLRYLGTECS